jgi:hypothetical protein
VRERRTEKETEMERETERERERERYRQHDVTCVVPVEDAVVSTRLRIAVPQ